jgi:spectinomycin phosphotransferase
MPPAGLGDEVVIEEVASFWGLIVDQLRYVPEGGGSYHWRASTAEGARYFLTVDDLDRKPWLGADRESAYHGLRCAFETALALRQRARLAFVLGPVPALDGSSLWRIAPRYSLAVFPFVAGDAGRWGDAIGSERHDRLVRLLAELHLSTPAVASVARHAGMELPGRADLQASLAELGRPWTGGPYSEPARHHVAVHAGTIFRLLRAFDELTTQVTRRGADPVITHGEPHPGNLIQAAGLPFLVDWDTVALASPERDLWMLDDGSADSLALYRQVTGRPVDYSAISCYRLAWTLADLAAFTTLLRSEHQRDQDTEKAWRALNEVLDIGLSAGAAPWCVAR